MSLPLGYVEPRHRLGLLDDGLKERLVATRRAVREMLERDGDPGVEFYDADKVNAAAPLKDNLLFGRVNYRVANAQARVTEAMSAVIAELGLREAVERIGLDHQVGPAGRLLTAQQRASINLVRCLVKRPGHPRRRRRACALRRDAGAGDAQGLLETSEDRSLFFVLPNARQVGSFDAAMRIERGQVIVEGRMQEAPPQKELAGGVA